MRARGLFRRGLTGFDHRGAVFGAVVGVSTLGSGGWGCETATGWERFGGAGERGVGTLGTGTAGRVSGAGVGIRVDGVSGSGVTGGGSGGGTMT
jgi:hypothetical protein